MGAVVKITTVGSSAGIVLPKEILAKLHVEKGDSLYITETPQGIQLTPYDEEFDRQIEIGKKVMRKYRDALRKLAE
jgi:putative addiction module antidote